MLPCRSRDVPGVPSLDLTLSHSSRRTCEAAASASPQAPGLSLPRALGAPGSRETPPCAAAEEPPGDPAAPPLLGRHLRRSRLLLRLLGSAELRAAQPHPFPVRGGRRRASSGPLCAPGCECGPGRAGPGRAGRLRDRLRCFPSESGTGARPLIPAPRGLQAPVSGLRGARGGSERAAALRAFSHLLSVVLPQAGPGDRPP